MLSALRARGGAHQAHCCCRRSHQPPRQRLLHITHAASPGSSVELRRVLQMQQMLDDATPAAPPELPDEPAGTSGSSKPHSRGFGHGSSSRAKRAPPSKEEWQQLRSVGPAEPCPCCSGLKYQDCCQPFLSGAAAPRSAPELVRARLAATRTGNVSYLAATTHSDSVLALGGARNTASRYKRQCAMFKANQVVVAGMAHCRGDFDGSWVVLTILQSTADGELAGTKAPQMALLVRRDWQEAPRSFGNLFPGGQQAAGAAGPGSHDGDEQQQPWTFLKFINQFPEHGDAEVLVQLVQQHVPELLMDADGTTKQQQQQQQMTGRQLCFSWGSPWLSPRPDQAAQTGWYVDMLQPAAERLGGSSSGGSSGSRESGGLRLLPPGVLSFDDLLAAVAPRQQS